MTVSNPDQGDVFWDVLRCARLFYVGRTHDSEMIMENIDQETDVPVFVIVSTDYARDNLAPWEEQPVTLEAGQLWDRTRNDYASRRAHIIVIFTFQGGDYVVYDEIGGNGPNPKMKKEIDFRRVFGRLIEDTRTPDPLEAVCRNCPHLVRLHDSEGCTVTIPQNEDPDFGPTQTCPCCERDN